MPKKLSPYPHDAYLDPRLEADLITRLNRAEGHLRSVKQMLTNHEECDQILTQLAAVQGAIRQVTLKLLDEHVDSCVSACVEAGTAEGHAAIADLKHMLAMVLKAR